MATRTAQLFFWGALCWKTDNRRAPSARSTQSARSRTRRRVPLALLVWAAVRSVAPPPQRGGLQDPRDRLPRRCPRARQRQRRDPPLKVLPVPVGHRLGNARGPRARPRLRPVRAARRRAPARRAGLRARGARLSEFAVICATSSATSRILDGVGLAAKQAALAKVWARMVRSALREPLRSQLARRLQHDDRRLARGSKANRP